MKKFTIFSIVAVFAMALVGCSTTANTNTNSIVKTNTNVMANSNVAVVVNNNSNMAMNSNMMNSNVSRTDYDRDRAKYETNKGASNYHESKKKSANSKLILTFILTARRNVRRSKRGRGSNRILNASPTTEI